MRQREQQLGPQRLEQVPSPGKSTAQNRRLGPGLTAAPQPAMVTLSG